MVRELRSIGRVERFFGGGGFPLFALSLILLYEALLIGLLIAPAAETGLGGLVREFRIWCFGLDPASGGIDWAYAAGMIVPPLVLAPLFALLWWEPLRDRVARPATLAIPLISATVVVGGAAATLAALAGPATDPDLPFPADALRTALPAPEIRLTNQAGEPVDLEDLDGRVVLLTAVYASCPHTCPLILAQAKRAVAELDPRERADLSVVAVTLEPERDSPAALAELASRHRLETPLWNLLTGPAATVEETLDRMGISRARDPVTGLIDHANLFLLIDRGGRVAYRLTLGERQERWLVSALRLLLGEPRDVG